jgi:hypothetical protein
MILIALPFPDSRVLMYFPDQRQSGLKLRIPMLCLVDLSIYNPAGKRVSTLVNQPMQTGTAIAWNASGMPLGIYFARLRAGKRTETLRLLVLR